MIGRRPTGFGATPTYHPVNRLVVPEVAMRINRKTYFHNILSQGQWVVKKLDFIMGDEVTLRCRVSGVGMGYLYASYDNEEPSLLAIKKVTPGFHDIKFTVPYPILHKFKVGISTTVPKGYTIDRLPKEDRYKLHTNSMMVSQSPPMYETQGIGFGGLGAALQDINQTPQGGSDSASNPYWDGNWDNYSWSNGFAGRTATITNVNSNRVPESRGSYHGYYAHRSNVMSARFDDADKFLGWDAIEEKTYAIPAGIPVCVVMQFFALPKKTNSGGNVSGAGDGEMKDPYWKYAHDYQIDASKFHLLTSHWVVYNKNHAPPSYQDRTANKANGPIWNVGRFPHTGTQHSGSGFEVNGKLVNPDEIACKVEWYTNGVWSEPRTSPPSIPQTNQDGFTKVIYRVPRQLSPTTDKDILEELNTLGVDYRYETTKKYFPAPHRTSGNSANMTANKGYHVYARPLDADKQQEFEEDGDVYIAQRTINLDPIFQYALHPYAGRLASQGYKGDPEPGWQYLYSPGVTFADPEKMARMNNPELYNAFYPVGGFKTGGIVVAIGKSMSLRAASVLSNSATTNPSTVYNDQTWTTPDGSRIGTQAASPMRPKGLILSTDLEDGRMAGTEEQVQAVWKAKFGQPLSLDFFSQYSFKDQMPEKPTHYRVKDTDSGLYVEAPYQIIYYEIGPEYTGPYADYEIVESVETNAEGVEETITKLVITKPEGKPYAIGKGGSMYLNIRTMYGKVAYQKIDIIDEVEEQRTMATLGMTEEEILAYNLLNNPPEESTAAVAEIEQELQRLRDLANQNGQSGQSEPKLPRGAKYIRSEDKWKPNPEYYTRGGKLKAAGLLGGFKNALGGFTDSRDFYVEDVTEKWGASGSAGLNGIGFIDSADEDMEQILEGTGDIMKAMTNSTGASAGAVYNLLNGDVSKAKEKFLYVQDQIANANEDNDSIPWIAGEIVANTGAYMTKTSASGAAGLVGDMIGLGGYSSNGLGAPTEGQWAQASVAGEGVGKFVRATARGLAPEALTEGIDEGIGTLSAKFKANPVPYTLLAGGALVMVTPLGGFLARNIMTLAGGAIGLVPKAAKAIPESVGGIVSGTVQGAKEVGDSFAGNRKTRGTAASRRRNRRR